MSFIKICLCVPEIGEKIPLTCLFDHVWSRSDLTVDLSTSKSNQFTFVPSVPVVNLANSHKRFIRYLVNELSVYEHGRTHGRTYNRKTECIEAAF